MNKKSYMTSALLLLAVSPLAACGSSNATADASAEYPTKNIRWIVPFNPGGATDTGSRAVAKCLEGELGQTVVVENVTGAGGARGFQELAGAKPDGYTIGVTNTPISTSTPLTQGLDYRPEDLTPVAGLYQHGMMLVVGKNSPYSSVEDLLVQAKKNPGAISVGVPGLGSPKAIFFTALAKNYGIEFNVVPLDGTAAVNAAVMGGHVDVGGVDAEVASEPFVESGDFVPLVIIGDSRWDQSPETPTLEEIGYGNASLPAPLLFLAGPAGLPENVVTQLSAATEACLAEPGVTESIGNYIPKSFTGPEEVTSALETNMKTYSALISTGS